MRLKIGYIPPNWNEYINIERRSKFGANSLKQKEEQIISFFTKGKKFTGSYPIELILKPHFKDFRQDLDNFRYKGLLDGLVTAGVLKNDNLRHIQRIVIEPVFDTEECVDIEIKELKNDKVDER